MSYDLIVRPRTDGESAVEPPDVSRFLSQLAGCRGAAPRFRLVGEPQLYVEIDLELTPESRVRSIRVGVPLPNLDGSGATAIDVALELAAHLRWSAFDPQRDAELDRELTLRHQQDWRGAAGRAIGAVLADAERARLAESCQLVDGWYVPKQGSDDRAFILQQPPPRPYGVAQQLRRELASPVSVIGWTAAALSLVAGLWLWKWYLLLFAGAWTLLFGPTFFKLVRLMRDGAAMTVVHQRLMVLPMVRDKMVVEFEFSTGGLPRKARVAVPLAAARALLTAHAQLELLVLVHDTVLDHPQCLGLRGKGERVTSDTAQS